MREFKQTVTGEASSEHTALPAAQPQPPAQAQTAAPVAQPAPAQPAPPAAAPPPPAPAQPVEHQQQPS